MSTRERDDGPVGFAEVPESLAAVDVPAGLSAQELATSAKRLEQFESLLAELPRADEAEREALAYRINAVLRAMRAPGHERAESLLVRSALESKVLGGLVDSRGHNCRKEAVETLLACGYPFALEVAPEDLDFARSYGGDAWAAEAAEPWAKAMRQSRTAAAQVMSLGAVAHLLFLAARDQLGSVPGTASAVLGVGAAAVLWALRRVHPKRLTTPRYFALNGALLVALLAALPWVGAAGLVGPAAVVAAAFLGANTLRGD